MIHEIFFLIWTAAILLRINCSIVRDINEPKGIYLEEYCPEQASCPEGSHVLCMYYTPGKVTGPRCFQPMNITMTAELAQLILDITNAIRSKLALGKETGKKQKPLPRAYGMNKLQWDNELATFAQVMANQCVMRHDLCRASKRFAEPGQSAGLVRFTYPDWLPVSSGAKFQSKGLIKPKLMYAVTQAIRSWYNTKDHVIPEFIDRHPDFERIPGGGKLYLQMVFAKSTHMGCGIIGYTEYAYHDNNANLIYNSVQIICNFSARPKPDEPVYETNPPNKPGYTVRCGCPPGFDEDMACLCQNMTSNANTYCDEKNCKPAVVLLPIFTVEDMPHKESRRYDNEDETNEVAVPKSTDRSSRETFQIFPDTNFLEDSFKHPVILPYEQKEEFTTIIPSKRIVVKPRHFSRRYDDEIDSDVFSQFRRRIAPKPKKKLVIQKKNLKKPVPVKKVIKKKPPPPKLQRKKVEVKKKSIFSKAPKFTLPKPKLPPKPKPPIRKVIVTPKKTPKKTLPVAIKKNIPKKEPQLMQRKVLAVTPKPKKYINSTLTIAKPKNTIFKNKFRYFAEGKSPNGIRTDIKNINEETDNKLMNLLDTLEQEVKHIELDGSKKQIFDAKLRKIYGSLVAKPKKSEYAKPNLEAEENKQILRIGDFNQLPEEVENTNRLDKQMSDTEDRVQSKHLSDTEYDSRLDRTSSVYAAKDHKARIPAKHSEHLKDLNIDERDYVGYSKNSPRDYFNPHKYYGNDNITPNDRTEHFKERSLPRQETFKQRSIYRSDNYKLRELYADKKRFDPDKKGYDQEDDDRRFEAENDIGKRPRYKNEDYTDKDYKASYTDYMTDDENDRVKPQFEEENSDGTLDFDRRQFYQDKLNKLERKLNNGVDENQRHATHQRDVTRRLLQSSVMRPQNDLQKARAQRRPEVFHSKKMLDRSRSSKLNFYVPDRARSLHGF